MAPDRRLGESHPVNQDRGHRREALGGEYERGPGGPHEQGRRTNTRTSAVLGKPEDHRVLAREVNTNLKWCVVGAWLLRCGVPSMRSAIILDSSRTSRSLGSCLGLAGRPCRCDCFGPSGSRARCRASSRASGASAARPAPWVGVTAGLGRLVFAEGARRYCSRRYCYRRPCPGVEGVRSTVVEQNADTVAGQAPSLSRIALNARSAVRR